MRFFFIILLLQLTNCASNEEKRTNLQKLEAGVDAEKMEACLYFGKEKKDESTSKQIIEIIHSTENRNVAITCISALGYIAKSKDSTEALNEKIRKTNDSIIIYSILQSLYQISLKNGLDKPTKEAINYADVTHRKDSLVADFLDKFKSEFKDK